MKVSELTGATLDYWVARAAADTSQMEGLRWDKHGDDWVAFGTIGGSPEFACLVIPHTDSIILRMRLASKHQAQLWEPSRNWAQGGPIVDREKIATIEMGDPLEWHAIIGIEFDGNNNLVGKVEMTGPTPLVAAMRAYVASKFGDEVPDEVVAPAGPRPVPKDAKLWSDGIWRDSSGNELGPAA